MAQQIGAFEAKTHFERGKEMSRKEALEKLAEMRKLYSGEPGTFNIRKAIEEGRNPGSGSCVSAKVSGIICYI